MRANEKCISCIFSKQEKLVNSFQDEKKKSEYLNKVSEILNYYGCKESSPFLAEKVNDLYENYWGVSDDYSKIKQKYNSLLLEKETNLIEKIHSSSDALRECIKYVCIGNYIDFSAVEKVDDDLFEKLFLQKDNVKLDSEYDCFIKDLRNAKMLVYLTDNCGEIVLDKIFISFIQKEFPKIKITVIVRGKDVLNDATLEDAESVGLTKIVRCVRNGNGAPGTVIKNLSKEAKKLLLEADVIISKGQGNFESLVGEGFNPYYIFLCKCDLFVKRFCLERYQAVFAKEENLKFYD